MISFKYGKFLITNFIFEHNLSCKVDVTKIDKLLLDAPVK